MDRLTTGRRRARAGSVHVTELISRQARRTGPPAPVPRVSVPDCEVTAEIVATGPVSHRQPPARGGQAAKLAGLGAATLMLCGAVVVATVISQPRQEEHAAGRPALRITGDQALLPDRLDALDGLDGLDQDRPGPVEPPAAAQPGPGAAAGPAPPPVPGSAPGTSPATGRTTHATAPAADPGQVSPPLSDVALVEHFYDLLRSDPDSAYGLVDPGLLTTTLGEFLDSWSTVTGIEVLDVRERTGGVLAVVRMTLADGGHLQIRQLLTVADSPRRITGAQLLSAQRN